MSWQRAKRWRKFYGNNEQSLILYLSHLGQRDERDRARDTTPSAAVGAPASAPIATASAPTGTGVASSATGRRSERSTRSKATSVVTLLPCDGGENVTK